MKNNEFGENEDKYVMKRLNPDPRMDPFYNNFEKVEVAFKATKDIPNVCKKGKVFETFGGLVSGVDGIQFLNRNWFRPTFVKPKQ